MKANLSKALVRRNGNWIPAGFELRSDWVWKKWGDDPILEMPGCGCGNHPDCGHDEPPTLFWAGVITKGNSTIEVLLEQSWNGGRASGGYWDEWYDIAAPPAYWAGTGFDRIVADAVAQVRPAKQKSGGHQHKEERNA